MRTRRLCAAGLLFVLLAVLSGGCGRMPAPQESDKALSPAHFAAYKDEVLALLTDKGLEFEVEDIDFGEAGEDAIKDNPMRVFKVLLNTQPRVELAVALSNSDGYEHFAVSLAVQRASIEECRMKTRDYPYLTDVFNLLSAKSVSGWRCNRLMSTARKDIDKEYNEADGSIYLSRDYRFKADDTGTTMLQYQIYFQAGGSPSYYEETLIFKGYLAARA